MTLAETLLSKLGEWRPTSPGRATLTHADGDAGWSVSLTVEKADALSCQLAELSCTRSAGQAPDLKLWAEGCAKRVTGLMEPLKVIEVDLPRGEAILRSDAPTVRAGKRAHYELRLQGGCATLTRFTAGLEPGAKREPATFVLTHEVIGKLAEDLAGAAS